MTDPTDLPASICRICGAKIREGRGITDTSHAEDRAADLALRIERANPVHHGWSRTCEQCVAIRTAGDVLAIILPGHDLTEREIALVNPDALPIAEYALTGMRDEIVRERTGKPWKHLADHERHRLDREIDRVKRITRPSVDPRGACGLCGVRVSVGWHDAPIALRRPDGSNAPMCSTCWREWDRLRPHDLDGIRQVAAKLATGATWIAAQMRCYAEVPGADGNGYDTPWDYSPMINKLRDEVWTARPDLAPEDRREPYLAIRREREAALAAERRQREAANTW